MSLPESVILKSWLKMVLWTAGMTRVLCPLPHCAAVVLHRNLFKMFMELVRRIQESTSSVDYAMLEYCIREDLKLKRPPCDGGSRSGKIDY